MKLKLQEIQENASDLIHLNSHLLGIKGGTGNGDADEAAIEEMEFVYEPMSISL